MQELMSRVIADTGIPSDRYHLGKLILQCYKDVPDMIMQIDGATGEKETFKSVMHRSILCALALRKLGVKQHDVITLVASTHLDATIPMYAAFYLGIGIGAFNMDLNVHELGNIFKFTSPKVIFCENSNAKNIEEALQLLKLTSHIVTFGDKQDHTSFAEFLENKARVEVDNFKPTDIDPHTTNALLISSSGSTGAPKCITLTHENVAIGFPNILKICRKFPTPYEVIIVLSPTQWFTSFVMNVLSPLLKCTRVQSSAILTPEHVSFLFNKYKPNFTIVSPSFLTELVKSAIDCDFSSLEHVIIGGSAASEELLKKFRTLASNVFLQIGYEMSEIAGIFTDSINAPYGSVGTPYPHLQWKIVDTETKEIILEPKVLGELWLKGPSVTKGYYNNPEVTAATIDKDGWFKTGDLVYRDGNNNFYFVDRLKLLLKYKEHHLCPVQIEGAILVHPDVLDVAVTGFPEPDCGDLPVAVVVPRDGVNVTAQEIKDLVKNSLSDAKQLRGGVIFVKKIPMTSTQKVDRQKLKVLAMTLQRE